MKWNVLVAPISDHYEAKKNGLLPGTDNYFSLNVGVFLWKVTYRSDCFYVIFLCSVGSEKGATEKEDRRGILPFLSARE